MRQLTGMFLGTALACLAIVALGEKLVSAESEQFRLEAENRRHKTELLLLEHRVKFLEEQLALDRRRRAAVAAPLAPPPAGDQLPAGDRIPAQTLPTTPKE